MAFAALHVDVPEILVAAVAREAAADAHRVVVFLNALGLQGTPEKPLYLPARFLLYLGAALRLLSWELQGLHVHREAGLPDARRGIADAFQSLVDPAMDPNELEGRVLGVYVERFAWHAHRDLGAEVALDDLDDDAALDTVAEFVWAARHQGGPPAGP
jgi:hypothetical protein